MAAWGQGTARTDVSRGCISGGSCHGAGQAAVTTLCPAARKWDSYHLSLEVSAEK